MAAVRFLGGLVTVLLLTWAGYAIVHRPPHTDTSAPTLAGEQFPAVNRDALTPLQNRVLDIARQQFEAQPPPTTFTDGQDKPWSADFVCWVMRQAGAPVAGVADGSWRIPTVYDLEQYYQSVGRLEGPGYRPHPGDVMLWGVRSPMALHANIVVSAAGDTVITVGGDERGIGLRHTQLRPDLGLLGYGRLPW